jgi:hypothetical protein
MASCVLYRILVYCTESLSTKKSRAIVEYDDTSKEELFAGTPVMQREFKSVEIERIREKIGLSKRSSSDAPAKADASPPKQRIHFKRDREDAALESFEESKKAIDTKEDLEDSQVIVIKTFAIYLFGLLWLRLNKQRKRSSLSKNLMFPSLKEEEKAREERRQRWRWRQVRTRE